MDYTLLPLLIMALLVYIIYALKSEIKKLRDGLSITYDEINNIKRLLENQKNTQIAENSVIEQQEIVLNEVVDQDDLISVPPPLTLETEDIILTKEEELVLEESTSPIQHNSSFDTHQSTPKFDEPIIQKKSWIERFKEENPDIEKFIGENLINKIGILILVLGISFFVKYAIDKDWINEPARVGIGILAGGILLGVAHKLRQKFKAFSSVLVAGAISVFYFTIGIAFHDYQLFSQTTAFAIMVGITIFSVFVSIAYNRQELGILSTIAGFAVPFMVSTGQGNYHVLLTYIAILNIGMLIISYYKRWFLVNFTALLSTILVVGAWYLTLEKASMQSLQHALVYCTAFYLIFMIAFVINNIVNKTKFSDYEIGALILSTGLYFAIGTHAINQIDENYLGIFTMILGFVNIIFAYTIYKKYKFDKNIIYVLIGLALTLATITIPIQFQGNYITIFWACEAVLLFWLSQKSQLKGFVIAGVIVQFLALFSLFIDQQYYIHSYVPYILGFNLQFITALMVIGSYVFTYQLFHKYSFHFKFLNIEFNPVSYRKVIFNIALILAYVSPLIEIFYQAESYFTNFATTIFFLYLYHMLYSSVAVYVLQKKTDGLATRSKQIILFNAFLYILLAYRIPIWEKEESFFSNETGILFANYLHYITLALLIYQVWIYMKHSLLVNSKQFTLKSFVPWFLAFFVTYLLSTETNILLLANATGFEDFYDTKEHIIKVIFPILWGILSFAFLIFGIKRSMKVARVLALILLGITILKLFVYDIKDVSETGKIIAFILLGILILVISFVYQKIKKLVVDNEQSEK